MARIIAIANQKGGVGKTTTAINLSAALAHFNRRVLLIDMDPQGNTTRGLGVDNSLIEKCIFDVLLGNANIPQILIKTPQNSISLLPSKLSLSSLEMSQSYLGKETHLLLKNALKDFQDNYDYVIIDCPPSLGILTLNVLCACQSVIIPVQCEYFALDAITQMLAYIANVQNKYNCDLILEGFLLTMFDGKTRLGLDISSQIRNLFKENTFHTQIPRNISLPESNAKGLPVTIFRPSSSGAKAYFSLAKEIIDKE